jgi:hypothetical protein
MIPGAIGITMATDTWCAERLGQVAGVAGVMATLTKRACWLTFGNIALREGDVRPIGAKQIASFGRGMDSMDPVHDRISIQRSFSITVSPNDHGRPEGRP